MDETPTNEEREFMDGFTWEAPEYFHREKTKEWFLTFGIVTITIVIICIILGNVLFGVFLAIASLVLVVFAHRPPRNVKVELGHRGIIIDKTLYHWSELESFWIREEDLHPKVLVKSKKIFVPYIIVPLGDVHHEDVREHLLQYMEEQVHQEPFIQQLMEYFGF